MKEYFKEQLKICKPISEEDLPKLKGRSLYSEYEVGDKVLAFMERSFGDIEPPDTTPNINLRMETIVKRELDKLEEDFKFIRMTKTMPVLERK